MSNKTKFPSDDRRSRLFPILGDNSKEGRATSILLSCIEIVDEFRTRLLSNVGVNKIQRHNIKTFTEVEFPKFTELKDLRPDGYISVDRGQYKWSAIIEAKIGTNELYADQIEKYLKLARFQEVGCVITISNQFSALPGQHPVSVGGNLLRKVQLYHWSWMYILTEAQILIDSGGISDPEQKYILYELVRFLSHESTGVNSFVQMPETWKDIVSKAKHGTYYKPNDKEIVEVIGAWHEEGRDISLILSRILGLPVNLKISRRHIKDSKLRVSEDAKLLCNENCIQHSFEVPHAASYILVLADLKAGTIKVAMSLVVPEKPTVKGQVSWLINQVRNSKNPNIHVTFNWKGRNPPNTLALQDLLKDKDEALSNLPNANLREFEIAAISVDTRKFASRKNFVSILEKTVIDFYDDVGQYLKAWQPDAPKLKKIAEQTEPETDSINTSESENIANDAVN